MEDQTIATSRVKGSLNSTWEQQQGWGGEDLLPSRPASGILQSGCCTKYTRWQAFFNEKGAPSQILCSRQIYMEGYALLT